MPCSQVQLARVVVCVRVLADVVCVMIVVLIAHVDVVHAVGTVFVAIFRSWRCTLYCFNQINFIRCVGIPIVMNVKERSVASNFFRYRKHVGASGTL